MSDQQYNPEPLIRALAKHRVHFVVIGGVAATLHGSPVLTTDLDIAYERSAENLERLSSALMAVNARLRGVDDVPFVPDARALRSGSNFTFVTDFGDFDCLGWPDGINSFDQLAGRATEIQLGPHTVSVASIDDLIKMKQAAGRSKDQVGVMHLEAVREMKDPS